MLRRRHGDAGTTAGQAGTTAGQAGTTAGRERHRHAAMPAAAEMRRC
ncbi:hypothetical protein [Labrys wisconsinensis]|uniref:Uncharacterized protein n=1 Tax=Labrys wisconsinensis TaxID=425677 RepID=A0ABU0JMM2_9HYPH|nr:hypothetical protein [Labrys wisconsinensis]MDQ0474628.1 hypothetical protein [Labrys wisconsinensis]